MGFGSRIDRTGLDEGGGKESSKHVSHISGVSNHLEERIIYQDGWEVGE